jgi:hypothetical protein
MKKFQQPIPIAFQEQGKYKALRQQDANKLFEKYCNEFDHFKNTVTDSGANVVFNLSDSDITKVFDCFFNLKYSSKTRNGNLIWKTK